jgi:Yip1 domain
MDLNKLIQRARSVLVSPRTEWPAIAAAPATVADLFRDYFAVLAAIPPVCGFVKISLIGYAWHGFRVYRRGIAPGLSAALVEYIVSLVAVYALAVIVDALAPNFAGQPSRIQALKLVGYAYTAAWVAGFARLLPGLAGLIALAGGIYSVYLLYLGLPHTMKVPAERVAPYTAVVVVIALLIGWLIALITGGLYGTTLPDGLD